MALFFISMDKHLYQLWLSPKCMKIYMLPAKVYRYMWKMLFPSLWFLKSLSCANKSHGNRFINHFLLLPLIWMKQLQKKSSQFSRTLRWFRHLGTTVLWVSPAKCWKTPLGWSLKRTAGMLCDKNSIGSFWRTPVSPNTTHLQKGPSLGTKTAWKCVCLTGVHGETQTPSKTQQLFSGGRHQVKQFCPAIWWDKNYCTGKKYFRKSFCLFFNERAVHKTQASKPFNHCRGF